MSDSHKKAESVDQAVAILREGGLVAFPTETVYGLGGDASNEDAVRRIFAVKGRPFDHPLIVHIAGGEELDMWARDVPREARLLADRCWPGPLTMLLWRSPLASNAVTAGRETVGLRVPNHPLALELLHVFGGGLAAPSANRYGKVSPTTAAHVRADLGEDVDMVLDGGPCDVGVESTIIDLTGETPMLLRLGGVSIAVIEEILGGSIITESVGPSRAPGMMAAHYAPVARVELVEAPKLSERLATLMHGRQSNTRLRIGLLVPEAPTDLSGDLVVLVAGVDPAEYAHNLYGRLREADQAGVDLLLTVLPSGDSGLSAAIRDRLQRAAAAHAYLDDNQ